MLHNAFKPSRVIWQGPHEDIDRVAWFLMRYEAQGTSGLWRHDSIKLGAMVQRKLALDTEKSYGSVGGNKVRQSFLLCVTFTFLAFDTKNRYISRVGGPWTQPMPESYDWDAGGFGHLFHHLWTTRFHSDALAYPCLTPTLDLVPAQGAELLTYEGWQGRQPVTDEWDLTREIPYALQYA